MEISPRLGHRVTLAQLLSLAGHQDEAAQVLEAGLRDHEFAPKFLKRKERGLARSANGLLKKVRQGGVGAP